MEWNRKNIGLIVDKSGEEKDNTLLMHYFAAIVRCGELFIVPLETRWKNFIKNYAAVFCGVLSRWISRDSA